MKPTQEQALDWAFECDFVESTPAEDVFSSIYVCCPKDIERLVTIAYEAGRTEEQVLREMKNVNVPPQREWQGLTDEERQECLYSDPIFGMAASTFARAIEAKLKEKNT